MTRDAGAPTGTLYLLPTPIADIPVEDVLPAQTLAIARRLDYFLAEDAKAARAFLKKVSHPRPLQQLEIVEIGHAPADDLVDAWLAPVHAHGRDAGIVSDAGCPGIADPGATLVARAHALGVPVRALVGPSSLLLGLMASGLDGQHFRFAGYLPQAPDACVQRVRELERDSVAGETQMFIETPYRNERLLATLLDTCAASTRLCVAVELTAGSERVETRTIAQWRALPAAGRPSLHHRPALFLLLAAPARAPSRGASAPAASRGTPAPDASRGAAARPRRSAGHRSR